jgi:hypothetical protein
MTQEEFLAKIARHLEAAGIPFMVAGSFGSSHHGQPTWIARISTAGHLFSE